jgi:hypothetical protein
MDITAKRESLIERTAQSMNDVHERWTGEPMEQDLATRLAREALQAARDSNHDLCIAFVSTPQ